MKERNDGERFLYSPRVIELVWYHPYLCIGYPFLVARRRHCRIMHVNFSS